LFDRILMKIAYIVPYVPNLFRTRPYNLISQLSSLGHEVVVFTLGSNKRDLIDAVSLNQRCSRVYYQHQPAWQSLLSSGIALSGGQPLQTYYSWHPGFASRMIKILGDKDALPAFDVIHVEHLRGSRYGLLLKANFPHRPIIWDSVDCISHLFKQASDQSRSIFGRVITSLELPRTRRAERRLLGQFDHTLVTSPVDRSSMLELGQGGRQIGPISVLPNGVDLDYYQPNQDRHRDLETMVFSGKMSYHANISMAKYLVAEIMPLIWQRRPNVRLMIVGKDPPGEIRRLGGDQRITVTGTVDDIRPYLWKATVSVVPLLYGAGIQNKILEAMASGIPIVTTSQAVSAIHVVEGKELLVADTPAEFSMEVLKLLESPKLRKDVSDAGLRYVNKSHRWGNIAYRLIDIYRQAILDKVHES
jgi:glycosyltransferase involved in cell wall biosynthesis